MFFTKGVGMHKEYLSLFELALREAKIEKCNLVTWKYSENYTMAIIIINRR